MRPTIVTYPGGSVSEPARVTNVYDGEGGAQILVTDLTPFHPLDAWWPDQPSDRGTITVLGEALAIDRAVLVGTHQGTSEVRIGDIGGVKRSDEEWVWSVGHVVRGSRTREELVNAECRLEVDPAYRHAIAIGHTGCHIAALALNRALETFWTKSISKDSFGNNNFDQEAIVSSRIEEFGSIDHYRIGKGVRRAGLAADKFWSQFDELASKVEEGCNQILKDISSVEVAPNNTPFHARRTWIAIHNGSSLQMPCGGVHIKNPRDISNMQVKCRRLSDQSEFMMETNTEPSNR